MVNLRLAFAPLMSLAALFAAQPTPAAESSITIAVTGDIKQWPITKAVSDIILADASVRAVLLVGDTMNTSGATLEKCKAVYTGTYDRLVDRIYPCPGNHDVNKELDSPYTAYIAFWKERAHAPELYYSFDLGGWHFISLDSMTFLYGKDDAANAKQLEWLKKDLAAHPGVPVVAFWHVPAYSSARHGGNDELKKHFCRTIYAHGPALVFSGHTHVYERFGPVGPDGEQAPPERGLHHFVISPGGSKRGKGQKEDAKPPLPVVFHGDAQHVGFFTLSPDGGYRFAIKAIDESGKVSEIDSGVGKLDARKE